jgi:signal transduction histidine kinase
MPYDNNLTESLKTDQHYIWFSLTAIVILTLVLYKFTGPLGRNITKLRSFASKADHNESLDTEDLMEFPGDELGEIAEKIIKLYKRLQSTRKEQNILKRQLTQNVAHELKTPVASIQGYLETILNNSNINEETRLQFMQRCYAQSQRLTALLQDISTLNRMDDAPHLIDFTRVNISQTVRDIIKDTELQLSEKQMTFNNLLPDNIVINGSQSLVYSIFRNLTDNAIAYAGVGTEITLTATDNINEWQFIFKDNGIGVRHEHLARLFERFYLVDKGRSRKMGGTGLGLAIVKNAVLLHKGTIKVENRKEGGLMFTFFLKK